MSLFDPKRPDFPFEFQSMLMYAWVMDRDFTVQRINESLRSWMEKNGFDELCRRVEGAGVGIEEFMSTIFDHEDAHVGEGISEQLEYIAQRLESQPQSFGLEQGTPHEFMTTVVKSVREEQGWLAAIRFVKAGGYRLKSRSERDRVDIITVCQVEPNGAGWRVKGFQGQLQEAWSRVALSIKEGTKSGSVGLMGRNMSHNLGSHALYYLEEDETDDNKKKFCRYLRQRMELAAAFATNTPLSFVTCNLKDVLQAFKENKLLLSRIGKSEGVENVEVELDLPRQDRLLALPGGVIGSQAIYSILENIIRDSAKHASPRDRELPPLVITIRANEPDNQYRDDFIKVAVFDN